MNKESYFSPEQFAEAIKHLAADINPYERHPQGFKGKLSGHSALLVIDMQRYFLETDSHAFLPSAPEILPNVLRIIAAFRAAGQPVFFTRHGHANGDRGAMNRWWGGALEKGSGHWPLIDEINGFCRSGDIVDKCRYDAFFGTDLESNLLALSVSQLHICGVMTHLCCETTARAAFVRDFDVFMVADATATYNYELHLGSLRGLAQGFACISWSREYR